MLITRGCSALHRSSPTGGFSAAFMFPGQGSQYVGMAKDLLSRTPGVPEMFELASSVLGYDLAKLCIDGPAELLSSTSVSQPAIFVTSMAALHKLKLDNPLAVDSCHIASGLSLGEYTALCFAKSFSFEDGVRLTMARGNAMMKACQAVPTAMVSVMGLHIKEVSIVVSEINTILGRDELYIANHLGHTNYTLGGTVEACNLFKKFGKSHGAKLIKMLPVSGAFHTPYMDPATETLREALDQCLVHSPTVSVLSNVDGLPHIDSSSIREKLLKQLTKPVQWSLCNDYVLRHLDVRHDKSTKLQVYEIGPGTTCSGILKKHVLFDSATCLIDHVAG